MLSFLPGVVLEPKYAAIAAVVIVIAVILVWKLAKFALKIAVIVAAAVVLYLLLHNVAHFI